MLPQIARAQLENQEYGRWSHEHFVEADTVVVLERSQESGFPYELHRDARHIAFSVDRVTTRPFDGNVDIGLLVSSLEHGGR